MDLNDTKSRRTPQQRAGIELDDAPVETSQVPPARFAATQANDDPGAPTMQASAREAMPDGASADRGEPFHYEMIGTAGQGAMGTVHIARDTELLRRVALKELKPEAEAMAGARARFLREVQITAQLDHPNIVPIYALELAPGGAPAYTMKYVKGTTFRALLDEARDCFAGDQWPDETRSLPARLEHFLKVCDAMAYAHDKGVIHRDLKPANLMLGRHNEVYVMDWGLCRVLRQPDDMPADASMVLSSPDVSGSASETQSGAIVGTPKYMSPEQAQGRNDALDARSDQCALGLIVYEMATLNAPFEGTTAHTVLANAAAAKRRPIVHAYLGKRIPLELIAIIERATAFAAADRYASVADFAADIRRYLRGEAVRASPDTLWQRMQRSIGRHRQIVLNGVLALVALTAIAIGGLLWQNQRQIEFEHLRQQRLLGLSNAVADVSDQAQLRFLQLEGAMENLADSVKQTLAFGEPSSMRFYTNSEFHDPDRAPADLRPSATHAGKTSLNWAVWGYPPGTDAKHAQQQIGKLVALRPLFREIYLRSAQMIKGDNVDFYTEPATQLTADDSPLNVIVIALADGVYAHYPGWDGMPVDYDPRTRPWYQLAVGKHGPQWGHPYENAKAHLIELPLSIPLNVDDQFVGVVSAAFLPHLLVDSLFDPQSIAGVRAMYLLDQRGHIMTKVGDLITLPTPAPDTTMTMVFPLPALVQRIKSSQSGVLETRFRGHAMVLAYDQVAPFGWTIVAAADAKALFGPRAPRTAAANAASTGSQPPAYPQERM